MKKKYFVFIIQAYEELNLQSGMLANVTELQLIAESENEAVKKAKSLVKKKNYRLSAIIEKYENT